MMTKKLPAFWRKISLLALTIAPHVLWAKTEPPTAHLPSPPDSTITALGHCNPITKATINCATHTIELSAFVLYTFTGVEDPVVATWNNGQTAHKITVTPPGNWEWDASFTGCEPVHWQNTYNQPGSFFTGNIDITGSPLCANQTTDLIVHTSPAYTFTEYTWNPPGQASPLSPHEVSQPGLYALTVTDALGCTFTDQINVQQNQATFASFTYTANDQTVVFNNTSTNASSYAWDFGNGLTSALPNPTVTFTDPGVYNVCLTATGACSQTSCQFIDLNPDVPWTVTPTGRNHTIIVPASLSADILGQPLQTGDYIGVFYDAGGVLKCGGLGLWTGTNTSFAAYGNDATPPLKNGFSTGEGFRVKVWKAALNQIFDVTAQYAPVGTAGFVTHTSQFADDGISMMLSVTTAVTQACPLTTGWNMISSYIEPAHPDILDVFAPLAPHVSIIKDGLGVSAIPSIPINGIGNWNVLKGYQVKSTQPDTLILIGQKVVPENTPIPLTTGWQIISYLRDSPQNAATVFAGIQNQISLVKDNEGKLYSPQLGINTLGNMKPGQGYKVKALANTTLVYQANFSLPLEEKLERQNLLQMTHFVLDSNLNTGNNATLFLLDSIADVALDSLDEIGVFTEAGVLCGTGVYLGENLAISVWGDDTSTPFYVEGLQSEEAYHFRVWNNLEQYECKGFVSFLSGLDAYQPDAIEFIQHLDYGAPTDTLIVQSACNSFALNDQTYTASGTYTQVLPNAVGCDSTITLLLSIFPTPVLSVNNDTICPGETAVLTAMGADSYLWSTGETTGQITASPSASTTYTVEGLSNGCAALPTTAQVLLNLPPIVNLGTDTTIATGELITLFAPTGPGYTYLWSTGATTASIDVVATTGGLYSVTVFNEAGCSATDDIVILTTAVNDLHDAYKISLSPNPTSGMLSITVQGAPTVSVQVLDMQGKTVLEDISLVRDGLTRHLDLHSIPSGPYFVRILGEKFVRTLPVFKH